ncbi:MAG: DNA methyltransferase [Chloroflexota bacterium]
MNMDQLELPDGKATDAPAEDEIRVAYRERLREYLEDPAFRATEGFPVGDDEAILTLSDPPYYTACPNPFLPEIIERWKQERAKIREQLGLPEDGGNGGYHREPFATDVSEGKSDPIYNVHSYHTKVPHKAIMRYILHYTDPGDIVFDGFCGTGMTGVAAQLCGDRRQVEGLGYRVTEDGTVHDAAKSFSRLGPRRALLVDLSPAATFVASNYNKPLNPSGFVDEAREVLRRVTEECEWLYETWHPHCDASSRVKGRIAYTVWSEVFICPACGSEMTLWEASVDQRTWEVSNQLVCPACAARHTKLGLERAWETTYDDVMGKPVRRPKHVPVLISYVVGGHRYEKAPDAEDLDLIRRSEEGPLGRWFPNSPMMLKGEQWGDTWRAGYHAGISHIHHFYTKRNLRVLSDLRARAHEAQHRSALLFMLTSVLDRMSRRNRYMPQHRDNRSREVVGPLSGTLYIPGFSLEINPLPYLAGRVGPTAAGLPIRGRPSAAIATQSTSALQSVGGVLDYVFVDPPFGGNLMYSELNFISEGWLGVHTNNRSEAIISHSQGKGFIEYQELMETCFHEFYRLLKPGRWMTVEFHNSHNGVWSAIQEAIQRASFVVADVRTLDKQKGTTKQLTYASAVKQDLIISAYRPDAAFERRFVAQSGMPEGAWDFVRQHLEQVPVMVQKDGVLETVAERQPYLLFDRMVAFHVQRGATVPMSAAELYAGLRRYFVERDGMVFLPTQVAEYDRVRLLVKEVEQLPLFVTDERTTVQWLHRALDPSHGGCPQTYQELLPQFLRQLHQASHEALPELGEVLAENFLQDSAERWYVPDPDEVGDLEKVRHRALLREFGTYSLGRGRLRQFRTEAVRVGFADAYRRRDFAAILKVAERLPESVLQEDSELLMYYDTASLRA